MEEADEPPLPFSDRIRSFAKSSASDQTPHDKGYPPPPALVGRSSDHNASNPPPPRPFSNRGAIPDSYVKGKHKSGNGVVNSTSSALPPPAPPPPDTQDASEKHTPIASGEGKPGWPVRIKAGSKRFVKHTKDAIFHSWINVLLVFVPIGIAMNFAPLPESSKPTVVFAFNAIAIIPLAGLLSHATEVVASSMGDTWASLLNVTFGNAVELIIFIALVQNQIRIVQASILGSILANLLLILGMAFLLGGLRFREQIYNSTVTQMSACLLSLSVVSLLLPTAFHASFADPDIADSTTVKISRGTSVVLLLVYVLYLLFQLKSHAYMYESTPQHIIDEESHPGVLAEMMNSSSSESSSSSSDSDSSLGSHATKKKRFTRAVRKRIRRKSSATSSSHTVNSPPVHSPLHSPTSALSSVHGDMRSVMDEDLPQIDGDGEYFDQSLQQHHVHAGVLSGDEADTDGEREPRLTQPNVRDFETEQPGTHSNSPPTHREKKAEKHRKRHGRRSKHSKKSERQAELAEAEEVEKIPSDRTLAGSLAEQEKPRVNFSDDVGTIDPVTASPRRNFPRQISRPNFRAPPPLTSLLLNTVFTTPQPPRPAGAPKPTNLSIAHRTGVTLRRASSLPDRLNRPGASKCVPSSASRNRSNNEPAERAGTLVISDADAALKDAATDSSEDQKPEMSRTAAVVLLLCSTAIVAFCAELLVEEIPNMIENTSVSQSFIGLIVLPIVGNAAEHVTAVTVATKNKMDLAIGVAVGSSIQIALFVTPFVVLLGWAMNKDMTLYFNLFETVSLFVTAFVVNFLVLDGRSNYLEGSLLIAAYVIIALAAFFYPNESQQSLLGGV